MNEVLAELAGREEVVLLASAPSLTDGMAAQALSEFGLSSRMPSLLTGLGFTVSIGAEWRLIDDLRRVAIGLGNDSELWQDAHEYFFGQAQRSEMVGRPFYLCSGPGFAYHGLELDRELGESAYRSVAHVELAAASMAARRLAHEQAARGLIGDASIAILFLDGMSLYRVGAEAEAMPFLRQVANANEDSREVTVAQHLVGYYDCMRARSDLEKRSAQGLLRASHTSAATRDDREHLAHVKHSMALCMLKSQPDKRHGPIKLLRTSLEITRTTGDQFGEAKVLHSLGQVLAREISTLREAKRHLRRSLEIGELLGYTGHQASVLKSLLRAEKSTGSREELLIKLAALGESDPVRPDVRRGSRLIRKPRHGRGDSPGPG